MSRDGYTLVEMLAALAIIALAIGGLLGAVRAIGGLQSTTAASLATAEGGLRAQADLDRLLAGEGPFFSNGDGKLSGSPMGFTFECAGVTGCSAELASARSSTSLVTRRGDSDAQMQLALHGVDAPQFTYVGQLTAGPAWPPPEPGPRQRLVRIVLAGATATGKTPLASVRLWREEGRACSFDVVAQACRSKP